MLGLGIRNRAILGSKLNTFVIPKNFVSDTGDLIDDFEDASSWTVYRGEFTNDLTYYREGNNSTKFNATVAGASAYGEKNITPINFGGNAPDRVRVTFYLHDDTTKYSKIDIRFYSSADSTKYVNASIGNTILLNQGWNTIDVRASEWNVANSESWDNDMIRMLIGVVPTAGNNVQVSMDSIYAGVEMQNAILLTFDDGQKSIYEKAFPLLKNKNVKATLYVQTSLIDYSAAYVSSSNLITMDAAGWSIANHSDSGINFTTLTQAEIETALQNAENTLAGIGLSNSIKNVAYPSGGYNKTTVRQAMIDTNMVTGRISTSTGYCMGHPDQNLRIPTIASLGSDYSLESAIADIDSIDGVGIFYCHGLVESSPDVYQWTVSDFNSLVNYIKSLKIPIITIRDFLNAQDGQIVVMQ